MCAFVYHVGLVPSPGKCFGNPLVKGKRVKQRIAVNGIPISQLYTGRHLPYGITQCYLPPDTSERAPP